MKYCNSYLCGASNIAFQPSLIYISLTCPLFSAHEESIEYIWPILVLNGHKMSILCLCTWISGYVGKVLVALNTMLTGFITFFTGDFVVYFVFSHLDLCCSPQAALSRFEVKHKDASWLCYFWNSEVSSPEISHVYFVAIYSENMIHNVMYITYNH